MDRIRERIAAVVVTHNRKLLLGECLASLLRQSHPLDAVYVIDNCSTDGTCDFLVGRGLISSATDSPGSCGMIHYVRIPENTGSAGGFHEGLRVAAEAGFDWFWLMDDDMLTSRDALEVLVAKKATLENGGARPFILNSLVLAKEPMDGDLLAFPLQRLNKKGYPCVGVYYRRLREVEDRVVDGLYEWACLFNGTFIPARVVREIGLPNKDLFIWGDEKDYHWRIAKVFRFYTAVDSRVYHPRWLKETFDWKQYYNVRNMFIVNRYFNFTILRDLKLIVMSLIHGARRGRWGMKLVLRGIRDGLTGRLGRRDDLNP